MLKPFPEVHVPASCEVKTNGMVRADSIDKSFNLSVLTLPKYSSEIKTYSANLVVKFNAWLINMLLF